VAKQKEDRMGNITEDRMKAAMLPEGDVVRILLEQHARIQELFAQVKSATDQTGKQQAFDELRGLLAVHETAEEMVLRPSSRKAAGDKVVEARNQEEAEATKVLAELEKLDVDSAKFAELFAHFEHSVVEHAEAEEREEFPHVLSEVGEAQRRTMGSALIAAEKTAPTHPHPGAAGSTMAQWTAGPFASLMDRAKDALKKAMP
jgi:hemerythrin superfamily protein